MTCINRDLNQIPGSLALTATILYIRSEDWGEFIMADAACFSNEASREEWLNRQREARCIVWETKDDVILHTGSEKLRDNLLRSLRTERDHVREKMAEELARYTDRIEKLLAITHQPEDFNYE